jgi:anti-sigma B factor antagonist
LFLKYASCYGVDMTSLLNSSFDGDALHLHLHAPRFDAAAAREFKVEINNHWRPDVRRLTIDMSTVEFLDSSGIGALLSTYKRLAVGGAATVQLLHVKPAVQSVFELMRMHRIFDIQGT